MVASPDRRFYAFVVDRLIAWTLYAVAAWASYRWLIEPGRLWLGVGAIVGAVLLVSLLFALGTGLRGVTPGKAALGLRVVAADGGRPIGVGRALLRTTVLGVATLPTVGFGAGALAWTALVDPTGWRRGWHDQRAGSVVVDVRPVVVEEEVEEEAPRQVVNLTALRLVPASPTPPQRIPTRRGAPTRPGEPEPVLSPATPAKPPTSPTPRQGLGWPLVGDAPPAGAEPPAGRRIAAPSAAGPAAPAAPPAAPRRARARWQVSFDTGETFEVAGLTLVGRRPESRQGEPVKRLVTLASDDMSLSKTHAQFQVVPDGALVVMDRGSTNGSLLIRDGVTKRLAGAQPATLRDGDRVRFGDREMTVAKLG
nr:RDD family protein [Nocardioides flavescens]